jgi:hypothetical protein
MDLGASDRAGLKPPSPSESECFVSCKFHDFKTCVSSRDYLDMAMHTGHADKCGTVLLLIVVAPLIRPQLEATFQYPGIFLRVFYNHSLVLTDTGRPTRTPAIQEVFRNLK